MSLYSHNICDCLTRLQCYRTIGYSCILIGFIVLNNMNSEEIFKYLQTQQDDILLADSNKEAVNAFFTQVKDIFQKDVDLQQRLEHTKATKKALQGETTRYNEVVDLLRDNYNKTRQNLLTQTCPDDCRHLPTQFDKQLQELYRYRENSLWNRGSGHNMSILAKELGMKDPYAIQQVKGASDFYNNAVQDYISQLANNPFVMIPIVGQCSVPSNPLLKFILNHVPTDIAKELGKMGYAAYGSAITMFMQKLGLESSFVGIAMTAKDVKEVLMPRVFNNILGLDETVFRQVMRSMMQALSFRTVDDEVKPVCLSLIMWSYATRYPWPSDWEKLFLQDIVMAYLNNHLGKPLDEVPAMYCGADALSDKGKKYFNTIIETFKEDSAERAKGNTFPQNDSPWLNLLKKEGVSFSHFGSSAQTPLTRRDASVTRVFPKDQAGRAPAKEETTHQEPITLGIGGT
jgi:hypothetical protein